MKRRLQQLTFSACYMALDLEPLLRGELLEAMAAVLLRPSQGVSVGDASESGPSLDFEWPKVGPAIVHYPWGGNGPRIEHPPGILCTECQWQCGADGWPLPSCGREPQRVCAGCRALRARRQWGNGWQLCAECVASRLAAALCIDRAPRGDHGETGVAP
jgi:hypothetical protein